MQIKNSDQITFWQQHLDQYRSSNLSRSAYCREHGLKLHQLIYHIRQGSNKTAPVNGFAKVVVKNPPSAARSGSARLLIGDVAIELDSGIDPTWVARLIAAVGGRP